jgi:hypothetical protein
MSRTLNKRPPASPTSDREAGMGPLTSLMHGRVASGATALLGAWLVIAPWFYGFASEQKTGMQLIVATGSAIGILGTIRYFWPREGIVLSWANLFLGGWLLLAPWARGYETELDRFWNSTVVGTAVIVLSVWSICSTAIFNVMRDDPWRSRARAPDKRM